MEFTVAMKDTDGTITSSFFFTPKILSAICNAEVPELQAIQYFDFTYFDINFSKSIILFPAVETHPSLIDFFTFISSLISK